MLSLSFSHLLLGLFLGLRHAFEADHIAAVAAIVTRERNPLRSSFIGGFWGAGHLASLLLVGLPVVGFGLHFPHELDLPLELGVAAMIVFLGVGGLARSAATDGGHGHAHSMRRLARRPFFVGAAHGLAGSGALTLVILATMPSRMAGLAPWCWRCSRTAGAMQFACLRICCGAKRPLRTSNSCSPGSTRLIATGPKLASRC